MHLSSTPAVANGVPGCKGGKCGIGGCNVGFDDCDAVPGNGCETPTSTDVLNCGACTMPETCGGGGINSRCGIPGGGLSDGGACQPLTCAITGVVGSQTVNCGLGVSSTDPFTLASGESVSYHVTSGTSSATACTTGTLENTVTVTGVTYTKAESGVVITATRTSGPAATAGASAPFTVDAGAATKLAITSISPTTPTAGNPAPTRIGTSTIH